MKEEKNSDQPNEKETHTTKNDRDMWAINAKRISSDLRGFALDT